MSRGSFHFLRSSGLANTDCESLANLSGNSRDRRGTYCSGKCADGYYNSRGKLVYVGTEYKKRCPLCASTKLFYDTVTRRQAEIWKLEK